MDNLRTDMLDRVERGEIAELSPEVLNSLHWLVSDELVKARQREHKLHQAFELRYAAKASEALLADGRDTGTVHLPDGRFDVTVNRPKRVEWSQSELRKALDAMTPEDAKHYAKVEIKIDERKFAAAPPAVQALLSPARTVKVGKPTYSLAEREAA